MRLPALSVGSVWSNPMMMISHPPSFRAEMTKVCMCVSWIPVWHRSVPPETQLWPRWNLTGAYSAPEKQKTRCGGQRLLSCTVQNIGGRVAHPDEMLSCQFFIRRICNRLKFLYIFIRYLGTSHYHYQPQTAVLMTATSTLQEHFQELGNLPFFSQ